MSEISLRAYVDYIQGRLERDAHTEVVAQCRHVLETFPKYVEVYKLLARALMEQENYQEALDLFQRVLSADPGDFVAHVGMSDCYRERGAFQQAIWHLERAYEQVPTNIELQEAIKDLYIEDGKEPPRKIQLTSGALARLYINGKLYQQAILELRKALAADPERLDLQVLLAEALWLNRQVVEAGRVAAEILKRLPNSIAANRILAQLWLQAGQPREAKPFLDRVRELDPYQAYEIEHRGQRASADAFRLIMLDYSAARQAADMGAADWVSHIPSIKKEEGVTGPLAAPASAGPPETPDWLQDVLAAPVPAAPAPPPASPEAPPSVDLDQLFGAAPAGQPSAPPAGAPDWLQDVLGGAPTTPPPAPAAPAPEAETPDWLQDVLGGAPATPPPAPVAPAPGAETPDWLQDVLGAAPSAPPAVEAAPDWMREVLPEAPAPSEPIAPPETLAGAPEWLQDVLSEQTPPSVAAELGTRRIAGEGEREVPEWLGEILAGEPETAAGVEETPPAPAVVSDAWLDQFLTGAAPAAGTPELAVAPPEAPTTPEQGAIPDWLRAAAPVSGVSAVPPDMGELEPWDTPAGPPEGVTAPVEDAQAGEALPDWLQGAASVREEIPPAEAGLEEPAVETEEALPEWLRGEPAVSESRVPAFQEEEQVVPPSDEPTGEEASQEIPDWLAEGDLDSEDAVAWLEQLAAKYDPNFQGAGAGAPPAEPKAEEATVPAPEPEEEGLPEWLRTPAEAVSAEAPAPVAEAPEEIPEWLRVEEAPAAPAPAEAAPAREAAMAWLDEQVEGQGVSPAEIISEALTPDQPPVAVAPVPAGEAEAVSEEELPDWLREAGGQEQMARAIEAAEGIEEDELAWLDKALEAEPSTAEGVEGLLGEAAGVVAAPEGEELPDWLRGEEVAAVAPAPVAGAKEEEELPDWLKGAEAPAAAPAAPAPVAEAKEEEELPDWLKGAEVPAPAAAVVEAGAEEELPEWLRAEEAPAPAGVAAPAEVAAPTPVAEAKEEEELPDWLRGAEAPAPAAAVVEAEEELPEWLRAEEAPAPAGVAAPAEVAAPAPKPEAAGLTDWLKGTVEPPVTVEAEAKPAAPAPAPAPVEITGDFHDQLRVAREKLSGQQVEEALPYYENLISHGQMLEQTIADLNYALRSGAKVSPRVHRVLGDALRANGQLQEALAAYRAALDQL